MLKLQEDLNRVIEWSKLNNMELHEKKFELMCYRLPLTKDNDMGEILPFMNSNNFYKYTTPSAIEIEQKSVVRDLGILLSDHFTWTPHISVFKDRSKPVMLQS